jgi:hypothetical protein
MFFPKIDKKSLESCKSEKETVLQTNFVHYYCGKQRRPSYKRKSHTLLDIIIIIIILQQTNKKCGTLVLFMFFVKNDEIRVIVIIKVLKKRIKSRARRTP